MLISECTTAWSLSTRGALFTTAATGKDIPRGPDPEFFLFGAFDASDGYVAIGVIGDKVWHRFMSRHGS